MGSVPTTKKTPLTGVHVPCLTWFKDGADQEIDWELQREHLEFVISAGLEGVVIAGTNGEAVTLSSDEKARLLRLTREVAVQQGRPDLVITMGTSGHCTRDVVAETKIAAEAGADYLLVLVPSYFHFAMDADAICAFFEELATASPLPIMIYNFPGVVAGLDVNSDMFSRLGAHPNIVGCKLTCGGIAKVSRIAAEFAPTDFFALTGQSDWLVPGLSVGATGVVTGVANLYPRACAAIYDRYVAGDTAEATRLQLALAKAEWGFAKGGINGTKWVVAALRGYGAERAHCRRPYPRYEDAKKQAWIRDVVGALAVEEEKLGKRVIA
ncbi:hypothetical protein BN1708_011001 [Verticillium longisporum]|uniref:4-hydroxy-tetrahydrodipicolinate synthase n=1 Tax=Verticillium longisporum TaxID=100787 RepID=A0A0G4KVY5_VERLO|nr:hypothetical protein BN1708_011001 [Verticillium longisporum]